MHLHWARLTCYPLCRLSPSNPMHMKRRPGHIIRTGVALTVALIGLARWCHSEPNGGVKLAIAQTNTDATVSWPYPSRGFELEFATDLGATNWQPSPVTPILNNGLWTVTLTPGPENGFFRLKNHLQYFGFWAGSVAAGGSVLEQRGTVNFTMGAGPGASGDQAVAAGMKLMFFAPDFSDPNVQSQIDAMKPYATNLLAFFMMDEPDCV